MNRLDGKIALITGGNSGIGFATAKRFLAEGAHVYITGRRADKLNEAAKALGERAVPVQGDVAKPQDLDRLYRQIQSEHGRLDVVFANAGAATYSPLGSITEQHFDDLFASNVKGMVFTVQGALPLLREGASVILASSIVGSRGLPNNSIYAATKAAARSFARTWTTDLKSKGIRVNAISPGATDTEGLRDLVGTSTEGEGRLQKLAQSIPAGRLGTPDEVANAALFLASDESRYVTGIELFVDGGMAQV